MCVLELNKGWLNGVGVCLECVWKVTDGCLQVIKRGLEGMKRVSGKCHNLARVRTNKERLG